MHKGLRYGKTLILTITLKQDMEDSEVIQRLKTISGIIMIEMLFPGKVDPDLKRIYIAKVGTRSAKKIQNLILKDAGVLSVDFPAMRKLVKKPL